MKDLTVGDEFRQIVVFSFPMLLGNFFQQIYSLVDSIVVGHFLGKEALAAVGSSFPVLYTLIAFVIGIGSGGTVIISQYYGAKNLSKVRQMIDTILIFMLVASVTVTALGLLFSRHILRLINVPAEVFDMALVYLNISFAGSIFMFGYNATISILRGMGDSIRPLYFLILASVLNIAFDLFFVLVLGYGVGSVAFATVLAQAVAFVVSLYYLNQHRTNFKIHSRTMVFNRELFLKSMKIGLPTGFQQTFIAVGMMALMALVNTFGATVAAAYTIAGRIDSIATMPAMNLATALSIFTGQNLGAGRIDRAKRGLRSTVFIAGCISLLVTALVWIEGIWIMKLFTSDSQVILVGMQYLLVVSSFYIVFSTMFSFTGFLRGAGATLIPMFTSLLSLWVLRVPIAFLLSAKIGSDGIWWSIPVAWLFGLTINFFYFRSGRWIKSVVVKAEESLVVE